MISAVGVHFQADRAHNSSQFLEGTFPPEVPFLCTPVCIKRGGRPFAVLKYKRVLQPLSMEEILNFDRLSEEWAMSQARPCTPHSP